MNKVILMGRLTKDVELRSTPSGISACSFTIAVDRYSREEKKADFINCIAWRQTAEFISKYFQKGNSLALEGNIQTRTWEDNEGKKHYATEVIAEKVYFCESKSKSSEQTSGQASPMVEDSDLPF